MIQLADGYFKDGCGRCKLFATAQCKVHAWHKELTLFRTILLECGLQEEVKWKHPCYTYNGRNILLLSATNGYCSIAFFKGALMKDKEQLLVAQTENMQSVRQFRATTVMDILAVKTILKGYIKEAIELEKSGKKVALKSVGEFPVPMELKNIFDEDSDFKKAFQSLTPGRQKAYLFYFSQAKQSKTREVRIEKYREKILGGMGIND